MLFELLKIGQKQNRFFKIGISKITKIPISKIKFHFNYTYLESHWIEVS